VHKFLMKTHLWLGLIFGIFIVVICTTGSFLVIEEDLNKLLRPQLYQPTQGNASMQNIQENITQAYPNYKMNRIDFPQKDGLYQIQLSKQVEGKATNHTIYVDPGSGRVLGNVDNNSGFFSIILKLHRYLFLGDVFGKSKASIISGVMGIGLTFILISGAFIWWPGMRKWLSGFVIIRNKGKLIFNQGLHKTVGIATIPFLLVLTLTGVALDFDKDIFGWLGINRTEQVPTAQIKVSANDNQPLSLDRIIEIARTEYPQNKLIRAQIAQKPDQAYQISMKEGYNPNGTTRSNTTAYLDPYTGKILYKINPYKDINLYNTWRNGLHMARWGGLFSRILTFIIGMMPLFLMITGLVIWRVKTRIRKQYIPIHSAKV
jgi:uncharacterized iron-regulated membrane protein